MAKRGRISDFPECDTVTHLLSLPLEYDRKIKELVYLTDKYSKSGAIAVAIDKTLTELKTRPESAALAGR